MSIFNLPTQGLAQDTGISAIRRDQVNSVSVINPTGGGVAAFEFQSPANSWFIPRLSYFTFKFYITKGPAGSPLDDFDGVIAADLHTSVTEGGVQFRSLPASNVVQGLSHMINGVQVENCSAVPEISALIARSQQSNGYKRSTGSAYRYEGAQDLGNSNSISPRGSLQPWNASTVE